MVRGQEGDGWAYRTKVLKGKLLEGCLGRLGDIHWLGNGFGEAGWKAWLLMRVSGETCCDQRAYLKRWRGCLLIAGRVRGSLASIVARE